MVVHTTAERYLRQTVDPKIDDVKTKTDNLPANTDSFFSANMKLNKLEGNVSYPNVTTEETVTELLSGGNIRLVGDISIDLINFANTGTLILYEKINGTYRPIVTESTTGGTAYLFQMCKITDNDFKVTYQSDLAEGSALDIYHVSGWQGGS